MSLLMDALKQAEQNKVKDGQSVADDSVSDHDADESIGAERHFSETETTISEVYKTEDALPIEEVLAEKIEEKPLETALDFSEIEASITAENSVVEPAPPVVDTAPFNSMNDAQASEVPASASQTDVTAQAGNGQAFTIAPALSLYESAEALPPRSGGQLFREQEAAGNDQAYPADSRSVTNTPADAAKILAASRRREDATRKRQYLMLAALAATILILVVAYYFWVSMLNVQPPAQPGTLGPAAPMALEEEPQQQGQQDKINEKIMLAIAQPPRSDNPANAKPVAGPATRVASPPPAKAVKAPPRKPVNKVAPLPAKSVEKTPPRRLAAAPPSIYQLLTMGYQAYQENRILDARQHYQQALTRQSHNRDALLGLAAVAVRQGRNDEALSLYRRQLTLDPKDGAAQTGLLSLLSTSDPGANESLIKQMLREHGETDYLRFALGNVYAAQSRWEEARQSYFRAYSAAPQNANYLFNLAVSLDQLHQDRMALQYYQWAVDMAAERQLAKFDIEAARQRIRALSASVAVGQL